MKVRDMVRVPLGRRLGRGARPVHVLVGHGDGYFQLSYCGVSIPEVRRREVLDHDLCRRCVTITAKRAERA